MLIFLHQVQKIRLSEQLLSNPPIIFLTNCFVHHSFQESAGKSSDVMFCLTNSSLQRNKTEKRGKYSTGEAGNYCLKTDLSKQLITRVLWIHYLINELKK